MRFMDTRLILRFALTLVITLVFAIPSSAQYFGRNKVQYDDFDFRSFKTDHFEIFFYPEEKLAVSDAARMAERWYERHSRTFMREFYKRKPIILYANDADFHQTNAISGTLGEGTGGVTESLKERVIMPLTGSYADTDHVLGHELVHSFQYDIALSRQDSSRFAFQLVPLWLTEGMAEYFSVGRSDTHTAMWMRDAALRDDLPSIATITRDMSYFPYRYGQAYLAYIGGKYGDAAVANLFKLSGRVGVDSAFVYTLGITADSLSTEWAQAVKESYLPLTEGRDHPDDTGRKVLAEDMDGGEMNLAPVLSPDGQYVAFLSEKDIFNINLFIADANTGEVVRRLKSTTRNSHFDNIRFISSAGSWSPDGKQFAFITFVKGDNEIAIMDWSNGKIKRRISVAGVTAITNLAWSPDGGQLAFSGMDGGISDLYLLDLQSSEVQQLTDDRFSDLQPAWSPDGVHLAFTTDRGEDGTDFQKLSYGRERIGIINTETFEIEIVKPFDGMHHNAQFSPDGNSVFFISDHDGFKDIYRYELATRDVYRITNVKTGISGITKTSPAMSVAQQSGRMMFSVFSDGAYTVYAKEPGELQGTLYEPGEPDAYRLAATLPPDTGYDDGLVGNYLNDPLGGLPPDQDYAEESYSPRLKLDYVAPPTVGVQVGGVYGSGVSGGVGFFFSDMLGNQNLTVVAQANGTFKDVGAQVSYFNRANRINWGGQAAHIPLLFGTSRVGPNAVDPETGVVSRTIENIRQRIFVDQVQGIMSYPFSTTRRVDITGGATRYGFDYEVDRFFFNQFGVTRERSSLNELEPDAIYFAQAGVALVTDYSVFGFTSPIRGGRSRFAVTPFVGSQQYVRLEADYRRYFHTNPLTFAFRGLHVANIGARTGDQSDIFTQEYLGYANSIGFVRGYSFSSFDSFDECTPTSTGQCAEQERLFGTRMGLVSVETRIPLFGTPEFGLINFPYLPTEVSLFADGGVTWTEDDLPVWRFDSGSTPDRVPVFSTGVSTRMNFFGYTVIEIFYAKPWQRPGKGAHFGFQLIPGW